MNSESKESALSATRTVLQHYDPAIQKVMFQAGHVSMYEFEEAARTWKKMDVEGTLCVVLRNAAPFHQFVVMNRRSPDIYVEDISTPAFQVEEADPYLMYRNKDRGIVGIWCYDALERTELAKLLKNIPQSYKTVKQVRSVPPSPAKLPHAISAADFEKSLLSGASRQASLAPPSVANALASILGQASPQASPVRHGQPQTPHQPPHQPPLQPQAVKGMDKATLRAHLLRLANDDAFLETILRHL